MSELIRQFLVDNPVKPIEDPVEVAQAKEEAVAVVTKEQKIRNFLKAKRTEVESETGFFRQMQQGFAEPLQAVAQAAENLGLPVQFDEEQALLLRQQADLAAKDNPVLGTLGKVSGLLTLAAVVPTARLVGKTKTGVSGDLMLEGAAYGALQPQYEGYEDTRLRDMALGVATGGVLGQVLGKGGREIAQSQRLATLSLAEETINQSLAKGAKLNEAVQEAEKVVGKTMDDLGVTVQPVKEAADEVAINPSTKETVQVKQPVTAVGRAMKAVGDTADVVGGMISTRIGNISQPILKRVRKFEFDAKRMTTQYYEVSEPFIRTVNRMDAADKKVVDRALKNGYFDTVETVLAKYGDESVEQFRAVQRMLDNIQDDLVKVGYKTGKLPNYFPRLVKDVKGLRQAVGAEDLDKIDLALRKYADEKKIKVSDIPADKATDLIEQTIKGLPKTIAKKKRLESQRKIEEVDEVTDPFYAEATESLEAYLRTAAHNISKQRFFGKGYDIDNPNSIQALVRKELQSGAERDEMIGLLQARFINGELAPNAFFKGMRDMGYATTIANPMSALVQLADLGQGMVINGVRNTLRALFGKKDFDIDSVGLRDTILEEFETGSKWLDKLFRISGFKRMDKLSKETFINGAFRKDKALTSSAKGRDAFRKKYGELYGDETEQLIQDLQAGKATELVKFHLFNELSGIQPISLLEVPEAYAKNPNGRIFYMLKSFTLKQYDILRRNVYNEYKRGNKAGAVKFGVRYAAFVSALGGTVQTMRDLATGRSDPNEAIQKLPDRMLWESLNVLGFGTYVTERYLRQGDLPGFATNVIIPPTNLIQAAGKEFADIFSEASDAEIEPVLRNTPVVGPALPMMGMWYNFLFGGLESYLEEQDSKND